MPSRWARPTGDASFITDDRGRRDAAFMGRRTDAVITAIARWMVGAVEPAIA
jgi:hypothetical protein